MGTINKGSIFRDISGKVGNAVYSTTGKLKTIRSVPKRYRKKKKESQKDIERKGKFAIVMNLFSYQEQVPAVFKMGYQLRNKDKKTAWSLAISYHLENAVTGESPDYHIDFSKIKFSNALRPTENGWNAKFTREDKLFHVRWLINPFREKTTQLDDRPVIICYDSFENYFRVFGDKIVRSSLGLTFSTPYVDIGETEESHCWIFFTSADGKLVSETEYLGMLTIKR